MTDTKRALELAAETVRHAGAMTNAPLTYYIETVGEPSIWSGPLCVAAVKEPLDAVGFAYLRNAAPELAAVLCGLVADVEVLTSQRDAWRYMAEEHVRTMGRTPSTFLPAGAPEWLRSGARGTSSEVIFSHLTGIPIAGDRLDEPADPDDLRRCRLLLEAVPTFRTELHRMAEVGPAWAALVDRWDELCALMDREAPDWREGRGAMPRTYALMRSRRGVP